MELSVREHDRPRVTIVTNGNAFSNIALNQLFRNTLDQIDYQVIITNGLRRTKGNRWIEAWNLFRRWGWKYTSYKVATYILPAVRQIITGRSHFVTRTCKELKIPAITLRSVNTSLSRTQIESFGPDILLSYSCPYRISSKVLALPRIGCLNVHSSLLPEFAGVCTYVHVLAEGKSITGVTVHEMVAEFDAGQIVAQQEVEITPGISVCGLFAKQCSIAGVLLKEAISLCISMNCITGEKQDLSRRSYRGEPSSSDIKSLAARGHRLMKIQDLRIF